MVVQSLLMVDSMPQLMLYSLLTKAHILLFRYQFYLWGGLQVKTKMSFYLVCPYPQKSFSCLFPQAHFPTPFSKQHHHSFIFHTWAIIITSCTEPDNFSVFHFRAIWSCDLMFSRGRCQTMDLIPISFWVLTSWKISLWQVIRHEQKTS